MPSHRMPTERFFTTRGGAHRTRAALQERYRRERKTRLLKQSHEPPKGWVRGKQLTFMAEAQPGKMARTIPSRLMEEVERKIKSNNPHEKEWAVQRIVQHFNYVAEWNIRNYFKIHPDSPHTFDQIYSEMLLRQFRPFVKSVISHGASGAMYTLSVALGTFRIPVQKEKDWFEKSFLRKRDLPGWGKKGQKKVKVVDPSKMDRHAQRETEGIMHILDSIKLTPREKEIMVMRYQHDYTREEIAKIVGTSNQRIDQIEKKVIEQLKIKYHVPIEETIAERIQKNKNKKIDAENERMEKLVKKIMEGLGEAIKEYEKNKKNPPPQ